MKDLLKSVLFILFVWAGFSIDVWYGFLVLCMVGLLVVKYVREG